MAWLNIILVRNSFCPPRLTYSPEQTKCFADKFVEKWAFFLDFNKAFNPPCVFTKYATCPLPPKQNHLKMKVTAGELMFKVKLLPLQSNQYGLLFGFLYSFPIALKKFSLILKNTLTDDFLLEASGFDFKILADNIGTSVKATIKEHIKEKLTT